MQKIILAPPWIKYYLYGLCVICTLSLLESNMPIHWKYLGLLSTPIAYSRSFRDLHTGRAPIKPYGDEWMIQFESLPPQSILIQPHFILLKYFILCSWEDITHEQLHIFSIITPGMLAESDYCKLRRTLNLLRIQEKFGKANKWFPKRQQQPKYHPT